jgi:hypothetical protein
MADLHDIMVVLEEFDMILRVRYVASRDNPIDYFKVQSHPLEGRGASRSGANLAYMFMRSHGGLCAQWTGLRTACSPSCLGGRFLHELLGGWSWEYRQI